MASSPNPQHAFDFGIVAESAKSFASSDVHAPKSNGATEHGATVEASGSHTQNVRQGDQPSKSMPMPNQATSSDRAELANSFLSFEKMDRIAREKLQVIGQAQAVLREAFRDLDPIFVQMRAMLSQRGENRVPEDETNKLPGIKKWWTQLCEEYGVNFSFRGFQKRADKERNRSRVRTEPSQNDAVDEHDMTSDYEQKPGDWIRFSDFVNEECGEKASDMIRGMPREQASQLLYRVAARLLSLRYRGD